MKRTYDGLDYLYDRFIRGDSEAEIRVENDYRKLQLIAQLRDLREKAGLTQADLARKLNTTTAAIEALEDIDSDEHTLEEIQQAVSALGMQLEVRIVKKSTKPRRRKSASTAVLSPAHV